jgi:glycosyltransferase involved in cell wall biosynthesis
VIAYARGSVSEIVTEGVSGFIVDGLEGAVRATAEVGGLDRRACREAFERRFTVERMASEYVRLYRLARSGPRAGRMLLIGDGVA